MRYRPFGKTEIAVSAVSLALCDPAGRMRHADWKALVYSGLENGINAFEVVGSDPAILDGLAEALESIERRLAFVALRLGNTPGRSRDFSARTLFNTVEAALARSGLEYFDVAMLDDPATTELTPDALAMMKEMRKEGGVRLIGVAGQGDEIDAYLQTGAFDVLGIPYNMSSGWRERHRLKAAQDRDMAVIGYDYYPEAFRAAEPRGNGPMGWFRRKPEVAAADRAYDFLHYTPNWTAEEICLAFALTEPALATVQLGVEAAPRLAELARATERDLPAGLPSRIEMARFGGDAAARR